MNRRSFLRSSFASTLMAAAVKKNTFGFEPAAEAPAIRLSSLHPRLANQGWGSLLFDESIDGKLLQIGRRKFQHGVSTHARSDLVYLVGGRYSSFRAWVGVDDASAKSPEATARFLVYADGIKLFDSDVMKQHSPAARVEVDITGINVLRLVVTYIGAYANHVDWAEAELTPDPHSKSIPFQVPKASLQRIKSGDLTFFAGGSSLAGLELPNGKRINLRGSFGFGPHVRSGTDTRVDTSANFQSAQGGLGWDWQCESHSHRPWIAPIDTVFQWPDPSHGALWLPRGFGSKWQDPMVPQPFEDKTYDYGAFFNREDGLSLPMASVLDKENGFGISFIQSPRDVLLDLQISTTKKGEIRFSRAFHRLGGTLSKTAVHMDIVVHEPDVRAAMNTIVTRYPEYFDPPCKLAQQVGGGGAYSGWEGALETKKLSAMGFTMNWKASIDFPYMGQFLPPVKDDEKWNRFAGGGGGDFTAADEGRYGQTSIRQMSAYSTAMRAQGFYVLNYFNVTEFGANITYPAPHPKSANDPELWKDPNDFLHDKLEDAVLKTPGPLWTWGNGVIMDCGDPAYHDFLLQQAKRHVEKLPDSSGICIDRMDWLTRYNPNADDSVTWIDGPYRHLRRSWIALMEELGPVFHDANKVIFGNDMDRRLELMRHVDGFYDEHGYFPYNLNTSSFLALRKPLVCWTSDENPFGSDPDEYFQRLLYMGAFPTIPLPGNDHSAMPSEAVDRLYLDYGPFFIALRGRTWLLKPGVIEVAGSDAKANIFETPEAYVIFVGLAGRKNNVTLTLRGVSGTAKVLYPGGSEGESLAINNPAAAAIEVPLRRGCAMLILNKGNS
jgi:hypothetical protein